MGDTFTLTVVATDQNDGDTITFSISSGPAGLTIDSSTGVLTWADIVYAESSNFTVVASDGQASAIFTPKVSICNCQNGGKHHCAIIIYRCIWIIILLYSLDYKTMVPQLYDCITSPIRQYSLDYKTVLVQIEDCIPSTVNAKNT